MEVYLDNSATTEVSPEAAKKAREAMELVWGNPVSYTQLDVYKRQVCKRAAAVIIGIKTWHVVMYKRICMKRLNCASKRNRGSIVSVSYTHLVYFP